MSEQLGQFVQNSRFFILNKLPEIKINYAKYIEN